MKRQWLALVLVVVAAVAVYSPILQSGFLSDDYEALAVASRPDALSTITTQPLGGHVFRPMGFLSFWIEAKLWGEAPVWFHLDSILLHAIAAWLLMLVVHRWTRNQFLAIVSGALFVIFPAHHEAVTWISGRFDVLSTVLLLGSLWAFESSLTQSSRRWVFLTLAALAFATKETTFVLPLIVGLRCLAIRQPSERRRAVIGTFITLIPLTAFFLWRSRVVGSLLGGYEIFGESIVRAMSFRDLSAWFTAPIQMVLRNWNLPYLAVRVPQLPRLDLWLPAGIGLLLAVMLPATLKQWRRRWRGLFLWLAIVYLALAPAAPLLRTVSRTLEGSRLWYLASAAVAVGLAQLILIQRRWVRRAALAGIAGLWLAGIILNAGPWRLAGREARAITNALNDVGRSADGGVFSVFRSVPDNRFGAYVFRRGFGEYLDQHYPNLFQDRAMLGRTTVPSFSSCDEFESTRARLAVFDWESRAGALTRRRDLEQRLLEKNDQTGHTTMAVEDWIATMRLPEHFTAWQLKNFQLDGATLYPTGRGSGQLSLAVPDIPPEKLTSLTLRVRGSAARDIVPVSLYWSGRGEPLDEYQRHILFPLRVNDGATTTTVRFCQFLAWQLSASLKQLRLHFPSDLSSVTIDALELDTP